MVFEISFASGKWPDILWYCCTAHICHEGGPPCAVHATNINRKLLVGALSSVRGYLKVIHVTALFGQNCARLQPEQRTAVT